MVTCEQGGIHVKVVRVMCLFVLSVVKAVEAAAHKDHS